MARREHSRRELKRKLSVKGAAFDTVAEVIDTLAAQSLQSDDRYAAAYIRSRANRGYGPQRIALELRTRGIDEALTAHGFATAECDWLALAREVDAKKFGSNPGPSFAVLVKRRRFLEYRGFTAPQIKRVLKGDADCDE